VILCDVNIDHVTELEMFLLIVIFPNGTISGGAQVRASSIMYIQSTRYSGLPEPQKGAHSPQLATGSFNCLSE